MNKTLALLLSLCILPGLAAARSFAPVPQEGQRIEYENGTPLLFIERETYSAVVVFEPESRKQGWISLGIRNNGSQQFLVSERSVSAASNGTQLKTFTYDELIKRQRRRETWAQIGAGLAAGLNSYNASQQGYSSYSGSYRGQSNATVYGGGKTAYVSGTSTGYVSGSYYDAGAAVQAQALADQRNRELIQQTAANSANQRAALEQRALRANTVSPEESIMGGVMITLPKKARGGATVTAQIQIDGHTETVVFNEVLL